MVSTSFKLTEYSSKALPKEFANLTLDTFQVITAIDKILISNLPLCENTKGLVVLSIEQDKATAKIDALYTEQQQKAIVKIIQKLGRQLNSAQTLTHRGAMYCARKAFEDINAIYLELKNP